MKYNNRFLKSYSRKKRQEQTYAEILLWSKLRNKNLLCYKFRRQHIIQKYIVDFFNSKKNLIIEIDGSSHDEKRLEKDLKREAELRELGFQILRFTEFEVRKDVNSVLTTILIALDTPHLNPLPKGEGSRHMSGLGEGLVFLV